MRHSEDILSEYPITARTVVPLSFGHIHRTFFVEAAEGNFILQWVNPIFGPEVMADIAQVTAHLRRKGVNTFSFVSTKKGEAFIPDKEGFWRVMTHIPGRTYLAADSEARVREAGRALGEFHAALKDFKGTLSHKRALHRDSRTHYESFKESVSGSQIDIDGELEVAFRAIDELPNLYFPENLPTRITHGDPKIANVLYSDDGTKAVALVDLDDLRSDLSVLVDLGDALRSWCQGNEDDVNSKFSLPYYKAALEGYFEGSGNFLTQEERARIPQAVKLITLELAARFARDIVEDNYFGWNEEKFSSRREHNRARTLSQVSFYKDLLAYEAELAAIAESY